MSKMRNVWTQRNKLSKGSDILGPKLVLSKLHELIIKKLIISFLVFAVKDYLTLLVIFSSQFIGKFYFQIMSNRESIVCFFDRWGQFLNSLQKHSNGNRFITLRKSVKNFKGINFLRVLNGVFINAKNFFFYYAKFYFLNFKFAKRKIYFSFNFILHRICVLF